MSPILDSGERRQFETGAVRDIREGKGRCDLLPLDVIADFMLDGSSAHILRSIEAFQRTGEHEYLRNVIRHFAFRDTSTAAKEDALLHQLSNTFLEVSKHFEEGCKKYGERNWQKGIPTHCYIDSAVRHYLKFLRGDTDEPHDRAFVWNILCCIWTCIHKPELNDYKKEKENEN